MSHEKLSNDLLFSKSKLEVQSKEVTIVKNEIGDNALEATPPQPCGYFAAGTFGCGSSKLQSYAKRHMAMLWRNRRPDGIDRWKPISLRAPILGGFVLVSLLIIITLEGLSYMSSHNGNGGGVAFADPNGFSSVTTFGYLYFPTIIAVFYSMTWSWIDLDVKRLEPWFQLSQVNGAATKDSLQLQYPFDFLPFIPVSALRRGHWGVFLSGTVMLLVFWAVTPLLSAVFNIGPVTRSVSSLMSTSSTLIPLDQQSTNLDINILNAAYAISWLGQRLPPFTTAQYAAVPFQPIGAIGSKIALPSEIWTTSANKFSTYLLCSPAIVSLGSQGYTFDNGKGCVVPDLLSPYQPDPDVDFMVNYIGYYDNAQVDWALENPNCTAEFSNNFLAVWASSPYPQNSSTGCSNLTAIFCETRYDVQECTINVNASTLAIIDSNQLNGSDSRTTTVGIDSMLNTTAFEYILATGVNPTEQVTDLPNSEVLDQGPRLQKYNLSFPVSNMVGFAVALNPLTFEDLVFPSALQTAFELAHQLVFTTAFFSLLDPIDEQKAPPASRLGTLTSSPSAIILVRSVAIAVEAALGFIISCIIFLWYYYHHRRNHLACDPASIADVMDMIHTRRLSISENGFSEGHKAAAPEGGSLYGRHRLLEKPGFNFGVNEVEASSPLNSFNSTETTREKFCGIPRPFELRRGVGMCFIIIILLTIFGLVFLNLRSIKLNGIPLPTTNPTVLSILENYLPTIVATILEPVWVILNRLLCLLKPFDELRRGNARPARSLKARYTSLPPQLVIWRALRSGHLILAAVCVVAISTNLLAVSLSTLLNQQLTTASIPMVGSTRFLPVMNGDLISSYLPFLDPFYIALANLSYDTSLPPWLDHDTFYLPFSLDTSSSVSSSEAFSLQGFKASTIGFGVNVSCTNLQPGATVNGFDFQSSSDGLSANLTTSHLLPNGSIVTCVPGEFSGTSELSTGPRSAYFLPTGKLALEMMEEMSSAENIDDGGFCSTLLLAAWLRANNVPIAPEIGPGNSSASVGVSSLTIVTCTASLNAAEFHLMVDATGRVLSANRTTDYYEGSGEYFTGNGSQVNLINDALGLITFSAYEQGLGFWHNDSVTSDWMNSLMVIAQNSHDLVDPAAPAPSSADVIPLLESLYRQLFATILALSTHIFSENQVQNDVQMEVIVFVDRIFVSSAMFKLSVAVLSLHLTVAILYYTDRPKMFLPRMPTSIGAIVSYFPASRAVADFSELSGEEKGNRGGEQRYAYGRYIGIDGKTHIGIERHQNVVPLESNNPEVKRRRWGWHRLPDEREPRTWI